MKYSEYSGEALREEMKTCRAAFDALKDRGLKLDMSRGKPGKEQLDLVSDILTVLTDPADCIENGTDVRNYGVLAGLPAAKA